MYIRHSVYLTENQLGKIKSASKTGKSVTIRIDPTIRANYHLYLTQRQITKLANKKPHDITLSKTQIIKNGGFIFSIPAILAGIGAAAGIAGSAANVARAINQKKHETAIEKEQQRHNSQIEKMNKITGKGLRSAKKGRGVFLPGKKKYWE